MSNVSDINIFLLLGFSEWFEQNVLLFFLFLVIYLATLVANFLIISAVSFHHQLHKPMYFLLMNLSVMDLGSISVIIPKAMINALLNSREISYYGCITQVFSLFFFMLSDFFLLTVMAYDRYIAICNPLRYESIMDRKTCLLLAAIAWISGFLYSLLHTCSTFAINFCSNVLNQFFCDIPQLLKLSCDNSYLIEAEVILFSAMIVFVCFSFIIVSYVYIFKYVFRIPTSQGRSKAFSTCIPHLIVVSLFISTGSIAYFKPISDSPSDVDIIITVLYAMFPSLMNPIIYTMRNREIKVAWWKMFKCDIIYSTLSLDFIYKWFCNIRVFIFRKENQLHKQMAQ